MEISENPIRETADYVLQVGEFEGSDTYQVINKMTMVVEHSDYLLPRVLETVGELQNRLDEVREKISNPTKGTLLEAVKDDDSTHGVH